VKYFYTYQTKNLLNGKLYIGYHSTVNLNDGYIGCGIMSQSHADNYKKNNSKSAFIDAVSKYGYNNFKTEILCFFDTLEEAKEEERYLVNSDWVINSNTYNISLGGNGGRLSNATIRKDDIIKDFKNGMFKTHIAKKYNIGYGSLSILLENETRDIEPVKPLPYLKKYKDVIPEILLKRKTLPGYSISKAMTEYKMDFKTVKNILFGIEMIPKEKKKKELKGLSNKYLGKNLYLYDQKYTIDKPVSEFCIEFGIKQNNLRMLLCGLTKSANGFTLNPVKPVSLIKDGNIIYVKKYLSHFAKENGIPLISLRYLIEGKIKQTKGYTLNNNGK
jgi:hypothetical protein